MLISGNKVVWIVKIGKSTLQEVELRANMYHLTMPPQYPDTGGANRLPPDMADNCQGEKTSPTAFTYKSAFYSYMQGINRDVIIVATVDHSDIRVF